MPFTNKKRSRFILFLVDGVFVMLAWLVYWYLRVESGMFEMISEPEFTIPMLVIGLYWLIIFWISGLYRHYGVQSRFDEFTTMVKAVTYGVVLLFFLIYLDDAISQEPATTSRLKIFLYWGILVLLLGVGRVAFRSIRRRMLIAGIGLRNTVIIGPVAKSMELYTTIRQFPALGYRILGFITTDEDSAEATGSLACLGRLAMLEQIIERSEVEEIIITLDSTEHERLLEIIGRCGAYKVGIKIRPDLYDIVSGQARTNQIYGIPLIEVTPQLMPPWEAFLKRLMDIVVSFLVLILGMPLFLIIAVAQTLSSRGPILYKQQRVGKDGRNFMILKFRTMYVDAEKKTGPRWAQKDDPRVTPLGRFLRRTHLDELPQCVNVLQGDMSLVGPRPERPFFVEQFIREIPLYRRRLNVRPGITGWAQVKHTYDQSIDDVRAKLRYDLFYIENMSLRMDFKIILSTAFDMLAGKGHT